MEAKEARRIAKSREGQIDLVLRMVRDAADQGRTAVGLGFFPTPETAKALDELGYVIRTPGPWGRDECIIDWRGE